MQPTTWRRREWLVLALAQAAGIVGCGTILHPERRGQYPTGRLDWSIVLLDAIGLLFFFIPGVIAFAVDFTTGAIYLPPAPPPGVPLAAGPLERVETGGPDPTLQQVEDLVSARAGRKVTLEPGKFRSEPLADLGDFWRTHKRWLGRSGNAAATT